MKKLRNSVHIFKFSQLSRDFDMNSGDLKERFKVNICDTIASQIFNVEIPSTLV